MSAQDDENGKAGQPEALPVDWHWLASGGSMDSAAAHLPPGWGS